MSDEPESIIDFLIDRAAEGGRAKVALTRLRQLHQPSVADDDIPRCRACVAGYDTVTGALVFAAWPCATAALLP
jgi:hypothetical protein